MLKGWTVDVHAQNNLNFVCSNLNLGIWKFQRRSIFWSKNWPCLGMGKLQLPSDENIELYLQNVVFLAGQCPHWDRAQSDFGKHRVHSRWARWCKVATQDAKLPFPSESESFPKASAQDCRLNLMLQESRSSNHLKMEEEYEYWLIYRNIWILKT